MSADDGLARIIGDCAWMIERNALIIMLSDNPEGPHQFRVGLRRLRSMLKAYRPLIERDGLRPVEDWAKELATAAGAWRDADVLVSDIVGRAVEASAIDAGAAALQRSVDAARRKARETAREQIRELDPAAFLDLVAEMAAERRWRPEAVAGSKGTAAKAAAKKRAEKRRRLDQPIAKHARRALDQAWAGVEDWGCRLDALSIDERHEMRKALKTLRYSASFFAPIFPGPETDAFLAALRKLQNVFGYLNDVAMAETLRDQFVDASARDRRGVAAAAVLAWHEARAEAAWEKAQRRWGVLSSLDRFW